MGYEISHQILGQQGRTTAASQSKVLRKVRVWSAEDSQEPVVGAEAAAPAVECPS
jgi:hypothetical protein